ncbi:MAG: hypothetical protein RBT34_09715, partial [Anaerolineaceae bacterium]|nr:hypothetical protein [Anaerolineaceae bacterium]
MQSQVDRSNKYLSQHLGTLGAFFQQPKNERSYSDAMKAAFYLWETYDIDVKEIVVRVLEKISLIPNGKRSLISEIGKTRQRRRLLHDFRLKDIAPEISPPRHPWPVLEEPFFISKRANEYEKWFDAWELSDNPFGTSHLSNDPLTLRTFVNPESWDAYTCMIPGIFHSIESEDLMVVIQKICQEFSGSKGDEIFTIAVPLPFLELEQDSSRYDYLASLTKVVGEQWIDYITRLYYDDEIEKIVCPTDFLDLDKEDQDKLAAFLAWVCGSSDALKLMLQERGLREYKNGRKLLEVLERILSKKTDIPYRIPEEQLFSWLQLRPPGRFSILMLLSYADEGEKGVAEEQAWNLMQFADSLSALDIILKMFCTDRIFPSNSIETIPVIWKKSSLQSMLSIRMQNASNGITSLDEFFGPVVVDCEERFLDAANGSLTALLRLCNKLLDFHCASD